MIVGFVDENSQELGVGPICSALQVAPSTYYAAKRRQVAPSARAIRDVVMMQALMALFVANRKVYGAHKLWKAAKRAGHDIGRDQVARLMGQLGIHGVTRHKKVFTTRQDHRSARSRLGPDALLVAEQKVVVDADPDRARRVARERLGPYLRLSNYVANLRRIGFDADDVTFPGSDRLVDALAIHGDPETVADGLRAHLAAGANQVAIQVLSADDDILPGARALAQLL